MDQHVASPKHYIREWRKYRGLTQAQLAEAVAIDRSHINKIERGKRYHARPLLEAIAAKLNCDPSDLIRRHPCYTSEFETFYMSLSADERSLALDLLKRAFTR